MMQSNLQPEFKQGRQTQSLRRDMIVGSLWMVAMRWSIRCIGLISTILLARILVPQDFGLVAIATIMVGLLDTLSSFGVDLALIKNADATRRHFDTAWTIQAIQGTGVALLLVLTAPLAAWYFHEPRVVSLVRFLAIGVAIGGFANIGVVAFRKDLDFGLEYRFSVYKKIISFAVTLGLALTLRNYWALAAGIVVSQVLGVFLSYRMHPYRPKFSMEAVSEIWSFSQGMLLVNVGHYAYEKGDEMVVGNLSGPGQMGLYTVAYEISNLPTTEMLFPISRALFPGYAKLVAEPDRLVKAYLNVLAFVSTFSVAAGFGIALVAADLTSIMLGSKWMDAVPLIQWLAFFGVLRAIYGQAGNVLLALGRTKLLAVITWLQVVLLVPSTVIAGTNYGIIGIAIAKLGVAMVFAVLLFYALIRTTTVTVLDLVLQVWRPCLAGLTMIVAVLSVHQSFGGIAVLSLAWDATVGAAVYLSTIVLLWIACGRPDGTERFIIQMIADRYKRLRLS
jgi:O-antigen/teichoic acid export membrane protein